MKAVVHSNRMDRMAIDPSILGEVLTAVNGCPINPRRGNTLPVRTYILETLSRFGWAESLEVDCKSGITITSAKGRVGLCFQTGNMSRMYADLLKLQTVYKRGIIDAAIMLLPTAEVAHRFGSNVANQERLMRELKIFEGVITVPMAIVGLDMGGN